MASILFTPNFNADFNDLFTKVYFSFVPNSIQKSLISKLHYSLADVEQSYPLESFKTEERRIHRGRKKDKRQEEIVKNE